MSYTDNAAHIAAPVAFEYSGKTYLFSPPTLRDFKEVVNYMRSEILQTAEVEVKGIESKELRDLIYGKAFKERDEVMIDSPRFNYAMQHDPDVISYVVWTMLRKTDPSLTREAASLMLQSIGTASDEAKKAELQSKMMSAVGYKEPDPNADAPSKAKTTGKRSR